MSDYTELIKALRHYATSEYDKETGSCYAHWASVTLQAADAIEALQRACANYAEQNEELQQEYDSIAKSFNEAVELLHNRQPKWIHVKERLPIHDMNVLICYDWTGKSGTVYREVGIASIEELEREPTKMFRPIAWMPLPKPPKEG